QNVTEIKSFMGMVNFYGKFVPSLANICAPLYNLMKQSVKFQWTAECESAFQSVKKKLVQSPVLAHFDPNLPIGISCDASSKGLGCVLFHRYPDKTERPIAFSSRIMTSTEMRYPQIEREALSIVYGFKKFYKYLCGRQSLLITDHKPLLAIFGPKSHLQSYAAIH